MGSEQLFDFCSLEDENLRILGIFSSRFSLRNLTWVPFVFADPAADSGPYLRGACGGGVHVLGVWQDPEVHRHETPPRVSLPTGRVLRHAQH